MLFLREGLFHVFKASWGVEWLKIVYRLIWAGLSSSNIKAFDDHMFLILQAHEFTLECFDSVRDPPEHIFPGVAPACTNKHREREQEATKLEASSNKTCKWSQETFAYIFESVFVSFTMRCSLFCYMLGPQGS